MSPIIGGVIWSDNGRQLGCRSLLKFNFNFLPETIIDDPSLITSAQLVLNPLQVLFSQNDIDKPAKFIVRRVLDNWVDTTTTWINQPSADSTVQVSKLIKVKNKHYPVSVDVTKLVIKMIKSGNNGFMIYPDISGQQLIASGQVFASPKYAFEELRPLLIIDYRGLRILTSGFNYWDRQIQDLPELRNFNNMQPANQPVMEPVIQPVTVPIKTTPVKD